MRLIDADALTATLGITDMDCNRCAWHDREWSRCKRGSDFEDACCAIENAPTIEERKVGKWEQIEVSYFADMDDETKTGMAIASMFCPRCKRYHNEVYLYGNPTFGVNFCPNCGASMVEGEEQP